MSTNGETYDIDSGIDPGSAGEDGTEAPGPGLEPAQSPAPGVAVDLAAWGRGQKEYVFGEIQTAIDDLIFDEVYQLVTARRGIVRDRRAAVQWLIDEGIISSAEARDDV